MTITRRGFLAASLPAGLLVAGRVSRAAMQEDQAGRGRFLHGVASGDPTAESVILWTRVTPSNLSERPRGEWVVARDAALRDVVVAGDFATSGERDWTVKIDASGLEADGWYWYGFRVGDAESPVGRTRTLPRGRAEAMRIAVFSCSNLPFGYFNSYGTAAARDDLDLALHLGDYIYEYRREDYGGEVGARLGRLVDPPHEVVALDDYRRRYAQYRLEPELQAIHARLPMVNVWDDHEIANNTWHSGAENHQEATEGSFLARREAAIQAFHEWLPVRSRPASARDRIYRTLQIGDLASLIMLDTRLIGRDRQLDYSEAVSLDRSGAEAFRRRLLDPSRSMLGATQEAWLKNELAQSKSAGVPWQILGQQLLLGELMTPKMADLVRGGADPARQRRLDFLADQDLPLNLDAWDGYAPANERLAQHALAFGDNVVVLAGDIHTSWGFDLFDHAGTQYGVELATTSITSPGFGENYLGGALADRFLERNPGLKLVDLDHRGYMVLTVTRESVENQWLYVDTVESREFQERAGGRVRTVARRGPGTAPLELL